MPLMRKTMRFTNRTQAGRLLADKLKNYTSNDVVVYALPRGGVVVAIEIAKFLHSPLGLIITRKISHPTNSEYAIAAISEYGHIEKSNMSFSNIDPYWFNEEIEIERDEIKRRRKKYSSGQQLIPVNGKTAILVDDGVATGLTMLAGIKDLKILNPKKIVIAVPVGPESTIYKLRKEVDDVIVLYAPDESSFLGAIGFYYDEFHQINDEKVMKMLDNYNKWFMNTS